MVAPTLLAERYRIDRQVGIGGMGTVFSAIDERLDRKVAVKVLKEELSSDERFVERFRREARAAGALSHPNIANVFDYGEDAGRYFIVMELVEGRDLSRVMREDGPLGPERALAIAEQIGLALGHAHAAGLVHRDVKPHNIIVMDEDRVKVTDFGIARAAGDATLTATGTIMGTAQYFSPEQASGEHPGPESDVYSLGIVLFEMATGAVPFTGDSPVSIALRHVRESVPAPSSIDPTVPAAIDDLVAKATARVPDERFADGNAFAAAIRGEPSAPPTAVAPAAATTTWPFAAPSRWDAAGLGRTVVIVFIVLFVMALAALGYRLANSEREEREPTADRRETPTTERTPVLPGAIELQDYVGVPADEAATELEGLGLVVIPESAECKEYPEGYVCKQEPKAGEILTEGDSVTLEISFSEDDEEGEDEDSGVGKDDKVPPGHEKKEKDD